MSCSPGWPSGGTRSSALMTTPKRWAYAAPPTGPRPLRCSIGTRLAICYGGSREAARWERSPRKAGGFLAGNMITLKSPRELEIMGRAGRILAQTLARMKEILRPGISTEDLDAEAVRFIRSHEGAVPSFKGLYGFPKTLCTSIDQEIVHGIPSPKRVLQEGSIVTLDVGVQLEGLHADSATTIPVGTITPAAERLLAVTQECLAAG